MLVVILLQDDVLDGGSRVAKAAVERACGVDGVGARGAIEKLNRFERTVGRVCGGGPERSSVGDRRRMACVNACPQILERASNIAIGGMR